MDEQVDLPPGTVEVLPSDGAWPCQFLVERFVLAQTLPGALRMGHVGCASVPGPATRSTVDVPAVGADLAGVRAKHPGLERIGYRYRPARPAADRDHVFSRWVSDGVRAHRLRVLAQSPPPGPVHDHGPLVATLPIKAAITADARPTRDPAAPDPVPV